MFNMTSGEFVESLRRVERAHPTQIPSNAQYYGNNAAGERCYAIVEKASIGHTCHLFKQREDGSLDTWDGQWQHKPARFMAVVTTSE